MKPKKTRSRFPVVGRKTRIFLGLLLAMVVGIAIFDWNWLRGPLVKHLHEKSGREVRIGDLHVSLGLALVPTVRLRDVYIQNASWASAQQPMAVAREIAFTFSIDSLWERRPVISRLVLIDANVDMERRADGTRNWRLTQPEYRGPGRVRVRTLQAERTTIRFVNGEIDFELVAQAQPAESAASGSRTADALPSKLAFEGSYQGVRFAGASLAGSELSFRDSGMSFPWRGYFTAGKTRLDFDGSFTDIFDLGPMDAQMRVAGPSLARLHPFLKFQPPETRAYKLEARMMRADKKYAFEKLHGKVGDTDIAGDATYEPEAERPLWIAKLRSESADLADVASLAGMNVQSGAPQAKPLRDLQAQTDKPKSTGAAAAASGRTAARPHGGGRLHAADMHLKVELKKLRAAAMPLVESLRFAVDLVDGSLQMTGIDLGAAGGHITGSVSFDGQAAQASLDARNIRLERLLPAQSSGAPAAGTLRSQVRLTGQGDTMAAVLGSSTGSFAAIVDGGRISNLADAKLALNVGKALGLKIRGDQDIALHCGAAAFDFRKGMGKSQVVVLETEQTHTDGAGTINLRDQNFDVLLTPQPKKPGLLTLNKSIRVQGSFHKAGFKIEERMPLQPGGSSAAQASIGALFRPLMDGGQPHGACVTVLGMQAASTKAVAVKE